MKRRAPATDEGSCASFPVTAWTILRTARRTAGRQQAEAINELVAIYWKPVYAYYRSLGQSTQDAQDLVQGLLCSLVERGKFTGVTTSKGRFRDWLKACAKHYLIDQHRRARAQKRRPHQGLVPLATPSLGALEPADHLDCNAAYRQAWRNEVLDRALGAVCQECRFRGRMLDYQVFLNYYSPSQPPQPTWKDLARRHGLESWRDAARKADWVKSRLARAVRQEVRNYVSDDEIDKEIQELLR